MNINLRTVLDVAPRNCCENCDCFEIVTKGATSIFTMDASHLTYLFDLDSEGNPDFKQMSFLFTNGPRVNKYDFYTGDHKVDPHFYYDSESSIFSFELSSDETLTWPVADVSHPIF